jgi:hypothetical protein
VPTEVVNIYHKLPYDCYIGRPRGGVDPRRVTPGDYGFLGNPFPLGKDNRDESIAKFKEYFLDRLDKDNSFREAVLSLKNKTLACFCVPKSCHGHVIAEWLDNN